MDFQGVRTLSLLRELKDKSRADHLFNGAAALAFYLTLAIFPALVLVMSVISYLPVPHVGDAVMDLLNQALPQQAFSLVSGVVRTVLQEQHGGLLSFGVAGTVWAASSGMYAIMQQLNVTYGVEEERGFLRARVVAIGLSLLFLALVLTGFSLIVLGGVLQDWLAARLGGGAVLMDFFAALRWVIIVLSIALALSLVYYLAPNLHGRRFTLVSLGGATGTVLLLAASFGFSVYVQNFADYNALYGSIGAVVALMLWLYTAGLALLVGAEVNVLAARHASPDAVRRTAAVH